MAMTSAAEAKLDARIRPEITALRARTPYPRRSSPATTDAAGQPEAVAPVPRAPEAPAVTRRTPVRLTRRGRIVVGTIAVIGTAAVASLIWLAISGQAQASGYAGPGTPARDSMLRVLVRPGESLWSIAVHADPSTDPRAIIPQIMDINSLPDTAIRAGQVLWVPKS